MSFPSKARDLDERWAQSPNREWFNQLKNKHGNRCCDDGDGRRIEDPDWREDADGYWVKTTPKYENSWVRVPDSAIVQENNRVGYAIMWPETTGKQNIGVMCFLPGSRS